MKTRSPWILERGVYVEDKNAVCRHDCWDWCSQRLHAEFFDKESPCPTCPDNLKRGAKAPPENKEPQRVALEG